MILPRRVSVVILAALLAGAAQAQTSGSASRSPSRAQGDPNGAVRALGSADADHGKGTVTVPNVGSGGDGHTGGVPAGTAR